MIRTHLVLTCDGGRPGRGCPATRAADPGLDPIRNRANAQLAGWIFRDNKDLCPNCQEVTPGQPVT